METRLAKDIRPGDFVVDQHGKRHKVTRSESVPIFQTSTGQAWEIQSDGVVFNVNSHDQVRWESGDA